MNPFAEKYKTLSLAQLPDIIDTPENYEAPAISAAEDELLARNLSIEEMAEARAENELHANEKEAKAERKNAFENKLVNTANSMIDAIHPVQKPPASLNRVILLISIFFGISGLIDLYHCADYLISIWHYNMRVSLMIPYFLLGFYLTGTALLFWKKIKWGWIFLTVYITYSASGAVFGVLFELLRRGLILGARTDYFPGNYPSLLFIILFYGCCAWFISKSETREIYKIDKYLGLITAAAGIFLTLATIVFAFHR
ncbi:MAG TPA: hypothetical protein VFE53_00355 [Mucilaginibacter sp.]|jgi:hypothetical protein|nr:hypothetical protein [Mucilaginibacter sp.]